jgi:hypothetical protein
MNPLHPSHLSPLERRRELCTILARGVVRLHLRQSSGLSADTGESSLHSAPHRNGHATATHRRNA